MMDNHNSRPSSAPQGGAGGEGPDAPPPEAGDWRSELSADVRDRIVNKIMETLKKHLPVSGPEGLWELKKVAVRFEEKIYHVASSQPDYLRKISLKMLTMESKSQNTISNSMPSNSSVCIDNPSDTVFMVLCISLSTPFLAVCFTVNFQRGGHGSIPLSVGSSLLSGAGQQSPGESPNNNEDLSLKLWLLDLM
ncbi:hypothetical protein MLD38_009702 [Melastoma candidum]|uniref:Uncharacterized protein n=1 Tax=Melastoma candidum TaxID=119954 RepID=A0ACB9RZX0_9MYRT|nr:hypothetical protein MLD38_009702 [Melastoma candidum]